MLFNQKEKLEEAEKNYLGVTIKKIRKIDATCEIHGEKSEECRKVMQEAGLKLVDE